MKPRLIDCGKNSSCCGPLTLLFLLVCSFVLFLFFSSCLPFLRLSYCYSRYWDGKVLIGIR